MKVELLKCKEKIGIKCNLKSVIIRNKKYQRHLRWENYQRNCEPLMYESK